MSKNGLRISGIFKQLDIPSNPMSRLVVDINNLRMLKMSTIFLKHLKYNMDTLNIFGFFGFELYASHQHKLK